MNGFHQYLPLAAIDDPLTEVVLYRARLLRRLGLRSEIFGGHFPLELSRAVRPVASFDAPDTAPVLFQATALPSEQSLPLSCQRVILTTSALQDAHGAAPRLAAWIDALGPRLAGVISELPGGDLPSGWARSVPLFDGSRASRRAPVLPPVPVGRLLVLCSKGDRAAAREIAALASDRLKREIEVRVVGAEKLEHPAETAGLFRRADAFLWGTGDSPLLQPLSALAFELPILAASTDFSRQILADEVQTEWSPASAAAALANVLGDAQVRRRVAARLRARREALEETAIATLASIAAGLGLQPRRIALPDGPAPKIVIEGSFETSYSLDVTNRELARALERASPGQVGLFPTHGYGDYRPKDEDLVQHPDLVKLWRHARRGEPPEVVVRGMYPPRVADMRGRRNLLHFAWEESNVPDEWVAEFNRRLDGILVVSTFVRKVLIDAGVRVPIFVIGNGVEQALSVPREPFRGPLGKGFKFLHVSSAFPRKGIDVLLRAYTTAFDQDDDVTLVLKTFPNQHHQIERDLAALRLDVPRAPTIVLINRDLPPGQLSDLYQRCDALVAPSRGEGFGLPMAEAMALGLPVITTGHGGVRDFAEPESTWLVDFSFAKARSHMALFDSVWAEPDVESLTQALRRVAVLSPKARRRATERAKELVTREHTWDRVAQRFTAALEELETPPPARPPLRLGWVSSWNTRCGIAAYSARLVEQLPKDAVEVRVFASRDHERKIEDQPFVRRCWTDHRQLDLKDLAQAIVAAGCEQVVLHFNFGFFDVRAFGDLLRRLRERGIGRVVIFHATRDRREGTALARIAPELARAERLLVHGVGDLNVFKQIGLLTNVALFPHGVSRTERADRDAQAARLGLAGKRVIGTYGYLRAHKGLVEMVRALPAILKAHPKAHLLMLNARYPSPDSDAVRKEVRQAVSALGLSARVTLVDDYLDDSESRAQLQAAELIAFPHQSTFESSSAAVRFGLSAHRPVVCTPLEIFDDVGDTVHRLAGTSPAEIASGVSDLLTHPKKLAATEARHEAWLETHAWETVSARLFGMLEALRRPTRSVATSARAG